MRLNIKQLQNKDLVTQWTATKTGSTEAVVLGSRVPLTNTINFKGPETFNRTYHMDKALDFRVMENRTVTVLVQSDMSSVLLLKEKNVSGTYINSTFVKENR